MSATGGVQKGAGVTLPKSVKVCGVPYTVRLDEAMNAKTDEMVDAEITYNQTDIRLAVGMPLAYEQRILWHELWHAAFLHTGHDEFRNNEQLVDTLANVIVQVIQDNWELVTYTSSREAGE